MKTFWTKALFLLLCFSTELSAELIQQTITINLPKEIRVLIKESQQQTESIVVVKFKSPHKSKIFSARDEFLNISENKHSIFFTSEASQNIHQDVKEMTILIPKIRDNAIFELNILGSTIVELSPLSPLKYRLDFEAEARLLVSDEDSWRDLLKIVSEKNMREKIILKTKKSSNPEDRLQYRTPVDAMFLDAFSHFMSE